MTVYSSQKYVLSLACACVGTTKMPCMVSKNFNVSSSTPFGKRGKPRKNLKLVFFLKVEASWSNLDLTCQGRSSVILSVTMGGMQSWMKSCKPFKTSQAQLNQRLLPFSSTLAESIIQLLVLVGCNSTLQNFSHAQTQTVCCFWNLQPHLLWRCSVLWKCSRICWTRDCPYRWLFGAFR